MGLSYTDDNLNQYVGPLDMTWDNYSASVHTPYEIRDNFNSQSDGVQSYPPWSAPAWVRYDPRGDGGVPAGRPSASPILAAATMAMRSTPPSLHRLGTIRSGPRRQYQAGSLLFGFLRLSRCIQLESRPVGVRSRGPGQRYWARDH